MKHYIPIQLIVCACALALAGCAARGRHPPPPEVEVIEGEPMITVVPMDSIPSIDAPQLVSAAEADEFMAPDEPVLGVVGLHGQAKAYSAWQLDGHEIVNDEIDGESIAVTW